MKVIGAHLKMSCRNRLCMFAEGKLPRKLILIREIPYATMLLKSIFVYHFNLMTSAIIYVPTLVLGRKLYSLIHLCVHLFNKHFSYS